MSRIQRRLPTTVGAFARALPVATFLLGVLLAPVALAGTWQGTEETVDGTLVVHNPAEAIDPPMTIELEESFRLGGWDGGEDEFFGVITSIIEDEQGNLYVLDSQLNEIKIYDAEGNFINTIGREGEGPGEFRGANALFWLPNGDIGVSQTFPGRIVTLTKDGMPGEDYRLAKNEEGGNRILFAAQSAGDHLAVVYGGFSIDQETMEWSQTRTLAYFDENGEIIAELTEADLSMNLQAPVIAESMFDGYWARWAVAPDGRTAVAPDLVSYTLKMWDADGSYDRTIVREYPDHERTDEEIAEIKAIYEGFTRNQIPNPNKSYEINEVHSPIDRGAVHFRPDGSLWVRSSRGSVGEPDDVLGVYDVYDPKGRFVRQVTLKGQCDNENDAVFFVGDRIVVITDFLSAAMAAQGGGGGDEEMLDEAEPMALICYRSSELDAAAGIPAATADSR